MTQAFNLDFMHAMRQFADKHFDLAVVDPPYGISINMNMGRKAGQKKKHEQKRWDNAIPDDAYFDELFRISKNQIIWGGNYFPLPLTGAWLFWDKHMPEGMSFASGELAWTSFPGVLRKINTRFTGVHLRDKDIIHPTQKPVRLYEWIYRKYLPEGGSVIDTHLGSGSNRIAAYKAGNIQFTGYELDQAYFESQEKRFNNYKSQINLIF